MIGYLNGKVIYKSASFIILEISGVGYKVEMITDGIQIGDSLSLYVYHYVREDAQKLFGFKRSEELEIFELLISVSGIGPKGGLAVLNVFSVEDLVQAIKSEDAAGLSTIKGLGKKTAERIILELKSKIDDFALSLGIQVGEGGVNKAQMQKEFDTPVWMEAQAALTSLGYSKDEIVEVFSRLYEEQGNDMSSDTIVRKSLTYLGK